MLFIIAFEFEVSIISFISDDKIIFVGLKLSWPVWDFAQFKTEKVEMYADENMVMIIFRNLISNAIKFTKPGGNINVSVTPGTKQVEISISDNGVGMDEEKIKTLFKVDSNATTLGTANEKGSGLGLILCKEFVEKHNGKIWVESEVGRGSVFKFTLPLNNLNEWELKTAITIKRSNGMRCQA